MSSKRYDDDVEMNERGQDFSEREAFLQKPASANEETTGGGGLASQLENHSAAAVLAYCFSSISMTVVNKYVVSGSSWNLNFLYLAIQAVICTAAILVLKQMGTITNLVALESSKAKKCKHYLQNMSMPNRAIPHCLLLLTLHQGCRYPCSSSA
jgi:GDP-mannose transporter